jgi:DNA adenine methylase
MIATRKKLRPPVKRHGGKAYLARRIIGLFPQHRVYVEPYLGAGSVLLNKPKSLREVAGDIEPGLMGMWTALASRTEQFVAYLAGISYSDAMFGWAITQTEEAVLHDSIPDAAAYLVRNRMSRGGLGKDFAWSERLRGKRRPGGPIPGDLNAWNTIREELPVIAERVKHVEFNCCDAIQLIRSNNHPGCLVYCDPPYYHATRTHTKAYDHEMTHDQHVELLDVLLGCEGKVFLSGYANPLYDGRLAGWKRHEWNLPNHSGQGKTKQRRIECVWEKP